MFEREIVPAAQPAILRGLVAPWPIVRAAIDGPRALAAWLGARATAAQGEAWFGPPDIAGRFDFNASLDGYNHDRKLATIAQLIDLLLRQLDESAPWSIFAGALPLARHLPDFARDHAMPLIDARRSMLTSLWLGNQTRTAAHWDLPQNLACVVSGRRRFTLFPIEQIDNLYVGPLDFTLAGQPSSLVDVDAPDFGRFPRFAEALAAAQVAELDPGDALYMPSLWWHAVRSQSPVSAMINYWWRDAPAGAISPMRALMLAAATLSGMPPHERAAWGRLFNHYLFAPDDPVGHLPASARGILGAPDAGRVRDVLRAVADAIG